MATEIAIPTPTPTQITQWLQQQEANGRPLGDIAKGWHPTELSSPIGDVQGSPEIPSPNQGSIRRGAPKPSGSDGSAA